ncbi:hypothetical protein JCM8115_000169 [Rhodotorula mucilaginosa]|uniref:Mannosyltransferase putative-domain-containing protein n=1 Tax=Rhodotorula mucilaginosa TaxID=5537 RepID=A0A9P6W7V6_RHOMI|nr:hypothetical protein C6P46_001182 [Rhodotorula mucilaginosa]
MNSLRPPSWLLHSLRDPRTRRPAVIVIAIASCCFLFFLTSSSSSHSENSYAYPPSRAPPGSEAAKVQDPDTLQSQAVSLLDALDARPILEYAPALEQESQPGRCPNTWRQANRDMMRNEGENVWPTMTAKDLAEARRKIVDKVKARFGWEQGGRPKSERELDVMLGQEGRGIVATAGNQDTAQRLLTTLRILRNRHRCSLPIEIWGFPDELSRLGSIRDEIDALDGDVRWRTVDIGKRDGRWKQFHIKGEVLARSSFSEILYLDSDSVPLTDPTFLFDSPTYKQHGAVLWPDFNRDAAANPIWRLLGNLHCTPARAWQAETGQMLIDKRARGGLNLVALEIARAMQEDEEFWFRLSGGDKDTFRFGFYFLSLPFAMAPHYPSSLGALHGDSFEGHAFCGHTMLQYGLDPDREWQHLRERGQLAQEQHLGPEELRHAPPLFVHANALKHSSFYNKRGDTFRQLKKPTDDRLFHPEARQLAIRPEDAVVPLDSIRQVGLGHRGICVDVWDASVGSAAGGAGEQVEGAPQGAYERGAVEILDWRDVFGGIGRDLEDMYYDEGGVAGAW